jgi:hypothetical protein
MSNFVSMDELERESAELLPSRETLCGWAPPCHPQPCCGPELSVCVSISLNICL